MGLNGPGIYGRDGAFVIQLYELLDYVWPNSVVLNLGEYENRHFIIKQQIDSKFTSRQGMDVYT